MLRTVALSLSLVLITLAGTASAIDYQFYGEGDGTTGSWATPIDWVPNAVPGINDTAYFWYITNVTLGGNQSIGGINFTMGDSTLGDAASADILTMAAGGTIIASGSGTTSLNSNLNMAGDMTLNASAGGNLYLGGAITGTGTITIANTGGGFSDLLGNNTAFTGIVQVDSGYFGYYAQGIQAVSKIVLNGGTTIVNSTDREFQVTNNSTLGTWGGNPVLTGKISVDSGKVLSLNTGGGNWIGINGELAGAGDIVLQHNPYWGPIAMGGTTANTSTGKFIASSGGVYLNKTAGVDAIGAAGTLQLNTTGSAIYNANDQLNDTASVIFNGGTLSPYNFTDTVGTATLLAGGYINFGGLGSGSLTFADSSAQAWTAEQFLEVDNWGVDTADILSFGGLTASQLAQVVFKNPVGFAAGTYTAKWAEGTSGALIPDVIYTVPRMKISNELNGGVEYTNPNATIGDGKDVQLVGVTTFGWITGTTHINADVNGQTFNLNSGGGNFYNYAGVLSGATGTVIAQHGPYPSWAPMRLSGTEANTFAGTTIVNNGALVLMKTAGLDAIAGKLQVNTNSYAILGAADQINNAAPITLNGGTFIANGFADAVGTLEVLKASAIDMGVAVNAPAAGTSSQISFADSSVVAWAAYTPLQILNYGTTTSNSLAFGTSDAGLSAAQLNVIRFVNPNGLTGVYGAVIDAAGVVTPGATPLILDSQWTNAAGGTFSDAANWSAGAPATFDATARFTTALAANANVNLTADAVIGTVAFDTQNAATGYNITGTNTLTLTSGISSVNGVNVISAPLALAADVTATITAGTKLTLAGPTSGGKTMTIASGEVDLANATNHIGVALNPGAVLNTTGTSTINLDTITKVGGANIGGTAPLHVTNLTDADTGQFNCSLASWTVDNLTIAGAMRYYPVANSTMEIGNIYVGGTGIQRQMYWGANGTINDPMTLKISGHSYIGGNIYVYGNNTTLQVTSATVIDGANELPGDRGGDFGGQQIRVRGNNFTIQNVSAGAADITRGLMVDTTGGDSVLNFTGGDMSFGGAAGLNSFLRLAPKWTFNTVANVTLTGNLKEATGYTNINLVKTGSGTLEIKGNLLNTGTTTIEAGTLALDGTIDTTKIVFAGGTLGGKGTVNFVDGLKITVPMGTLNASQMSFNLTGFSSGAEVTLVDLTGGAFVAPATLDSLLSSASASAGWHLKNTGTQLLAKIGVYGIIGDTNGDGTVDLTDLNNVRNNFGSTAVGITGDTNGDGTVDLTDLNNVRNHFGETMGATNVPEPATLALLSLGGLALLRRRNSK